MCVGSPPEKKKSYGGQTEKSHFIAKGGSQEI